MLTDNNTTPNSLARKTAAECVREQAFLKLEGREVNGRKFAPVYFSCVAFDKLLGRIYQVEIDGYVHDLFISPGGRSIRTYSKGRSKVAKETPDAR